LVYAKETRPEEREWGPGGGEEIGILRALRTFYKSSKKAKNEKKGKWRVETPRANWAYGFQRARGKLGPAPNSYTFDGKRKKEGKGGA